MKRHTLSTAILSLALTLCPPMLFCGKFITASASTNPLTFVEMVSSIGLDSARGVTLSSDGKHLYVTGSADDAVAVFYRSPTSGRLDFVEVKRDGEGGINELDGAVDVAVSADGRNVYVVSYFDDALTVFSRDYDSGKLTLV